MTGYDTLESPKNSTRNLEMINKFSNVERYKMNLHKSIAFLHTNKYAEKELTYTPLLTIVSKKKIYLE